MKNKIGWVIIGSSTLLIIISMYILSIGYVEYSFCLFLLSVILFIIGIIFVKKIEDQVEDYKELNELLNKYKNILKKVKKLPNIDNNIITNFTNIEDLIEIQTNINKPILYKKEIDKCTFIISKEEKTFIYIKKINNEEKKIEEINDNSEENKTKNKKYEIEILD